MGSVYKYLLMAASSIILLSGLAGCAAIGTSISHGHLQTQTLMSDSIFMDPTMGNYKKTIYLEIHNTTDKTGFDIESQLKELLQAKGYNISVNPDTANYVLQVDLLQMGRNSLSAAKEQMGFGYGGALEGGLASATLASSTTVGIAGAAAGSIVDNMVKDVTFSGIVDIKVVQHQHKKSKVYKTRILSTADKVNLRFSEAEPVLERGLATSISGLFN